jgi:hypothetical protein
MHSRPAAIIAGVTSISGAPASGASPSALMILHPAACGFKYIISLPILEQMGYEVTTFKVTWDLPPKARLRLKSNGGTDIQKVNAIAAKVTSGVLVSALMTSAVTAKRIQSIMKLGTAFLDVDFAIPPKVTMRFVNSKANEKEEPLRDSDELEIACK